MHPLNDHAWQSDTRMVFFLFMDSQGTVNGTFYDGQVFFRAKLQLVADPFPIFTFLPHDFWIEVVFHGQATNLDKLYHDGQAGNRPFILDIGKIPGFDVYLFCQVFSCEMLCFPRRLYVCAESFKTGANIGVQGVQTR